MNNYLNLDHLLSLMKGYGVKRLLLESGDQLITNGHMLAKLTADVPTGCEDAPPPAVSDLWAQCLHIPVQPLVADSCYQDCGKWIRSLTKKFFIQEAFYRCFSEECTWTLAPDHPRAKDIALVHIAGELIGLVMRYKFEVTRESVSGTPTDAEVLGPLAGEHNNWYLIDRATLKTKLQDAEQELRRAREKRDELKDEIKDWKKDIKSLQERLEALMLQSATPPKPDPSEPA